MTCQGQAPWRQPRHVTRVPWAPTPSLEGWHGISSRTWGGSDKAKTQTGDTWTCPAISSSVWYRSSRRETWPRLTVVLTGHWAISTACLRPRGSAPAKSGCWVRGSRCYCEGGGQLGIPPREFRQASSQEVCTQTQTTETYTQGPAGPESPALARSQQRDGSGVGVSLHESPLGHAPLPLGWGASSADAE